MNHDEWLKWRNKGIGGSDCSAILGLNPYMTNIELWEDKALDKRKEFKGNQEILDRGHKVEPLVRELFAIDHPEYTVEYKDNDHFVSKVYDFIRGTVDGRLTEKSTGLKGILEIKHAQIENRQQLEKWKIDSFPQNYYCQVLHYLYVTGLEFCVLKARIRRAFEDSVYIVEREYTIKKQDHQESMDFLIGKEVEFWNKYVVPKKVPPLVLPAI
jgi:putative phage-type endonuclease